MAEKSRQVLEKVIENAIIDGNNGLTPAEGRLSALILFTADAKDEDV